MKVQLIILSIFFLIFGIENNSLSFTTNILNEDKKESYEACIRLRTKAPNLNLKCEHLLDTINRNEENQKKDEINYAEIKTLIIRESNTRKVNKSEEIKLRDLIKKLSNDNKQRKD